MRHIQRNVSFLPSSISISYEKRISQRESRRINSSIAQLQHLLSFVQLQQQAPHPHPPIWLLWPPCGALLPASPSACLSVCPTNKANGPSNGGRQQLSTVAHALSLSVNVGAEAEGGDEDAHTA